MPCIIPARGGSKGIPRKNVREFCGKPLLAWSIEQAKASRYISDVWVTTDCEEIAAVAREYGAAVHERSRHSASDTAPSEWALAECLERVWGRSADCVVFLQATSPLRQPNDIDGCASLVLNGGADSSFSARVVEGYCWRLGRHESGDATLSPTYSTRIPRQSRTVETLEENGSIYCFRPHILLDHNNRLGGSVACWKMHPLDSFQLDNPSDWEMLEQIAEVRYGYHRAAAN